MPTYATVRLRNFTEPVDVDLDTLTPKARALAEAISMSFDHQPLGVLCDTGRTKGDNPHHAYWHGTGPKADAIADEPDLRFMTNLELLHAGSSTSEAEWLEYNARQIPYYAWPIAGARSRMEPLEERVPSAEAAREDRCLTAEQAQRYLADLGVSLTKDAWTTLQRVEHAPRPYRYALGEMMPLWHADQLDAYAQRPHERWTISRVAEELGYTGPSATGTARKQLHRWGLAASGRAAGRGGESLYAADQVRALHGARPGRGRRTDLTSP
ncbi:hypothetical protein [Streptomyces sulphureus]|uniref:hypothetical protein n=1 Tax=Streptomyces sulphureus TaxID=47758 RepID=UPI00036AF116|nr:hypothetical protein [Streptomyces sulphureus]